MSDGINKILARLAELGFRTREGGLAPFGEELPLVGGVAWDTTTAQIALIAGMQDEADIAEWRQLLFAAAGLRHHLGGDSAAAFGPPVIVALVGTEGWHRLRDMAEDLAANYVLFNRVDLNLIHRSDVDDRERLDDALAPLLPRSRARLGQEISRAEVKRFWTLLRTEIQRTATQLDAVFKADRDRVGAELAERLIDGDDDQAELPSPLPLHRMSVRDFRSIREADIEFGPVTIVHGPNGGGKSSLLEAMELIWAGTSLRKPAAVAAEEYARHLPRNGNGTFSVSSDDRDVTDIAEKARAELSRSVLIQESVAALVSQSPDERYQALLTTTGLEVPNLAARAQSLLDDAKRRADSVLIAAGLPALPRRDSIAVKHLRESLRTRFAQRLPSVHDLVGAEEVLSAAAAGTYAPRPWPRDEHAVGPLIRADTVISEALEGALRPGAVAEALDDAGTQVNALLASRREILEPLRRLEQLMRSPIPQSVDEVGEQVSPVPVRQDVAARWLAHANSQRDAAARFRSDAAAIQDQAWAERLRSYADRVQATATSAPIPDLEKFTRRAPKSSARDTIPLVPREVYSAAGFSAPPAEPTTIASAVKELRTVLEQQIDTLEQLQHDLRDHPARGFHEHADAVLSSLCRFELARRMRSAGPILDASERLVSELLQDRLAPVVRELVASIVRFEWYFKPLLVPKKGRKVVLGGLATSQPDLDVRLLLNSAERTALGIAWFLALHLLQSPERQRVLVLDDPASVFDAPNQAGLVSTLRAFVRLTRPEQLVIATHDDAFAAVLAEEFASVDSWPTDCVKVRCQRDSSDCSVVVSTRGSETSLSIDAEAHRLGLGEAPALR